MKDERKPWECPAVSGRTRSRWDAFYTSICPDDNNPNLGDGECKAEANISEDTIDVDNVFASYNIRTEAREFNITQPRKKPCRRVGIETEKPNLAKLLADFISREEFLSPKHGHVSASLDWLTKFKFEDDPNPVSEEETKRNAEIESLFIELEMCLCESGTGLNDNSSTIEVEMRDETPAARCGCGVHDPFLDEEIGIVCRLCSVLLVDIKFVLPPMIAEAYQRSASTVERSKSDRSTISGVDFEQARSGGDFIFPVSLKEGTVMDLIPRGETELYSHQLDAFMFLWRRIAGETRIDKLPPNLPDSGGRGAIICHAPGTGKTRLAIVFLETMMKLYPSCRPMIVAPRGMLLSWEKEFRRYAVEMNFHNLNNSSLTREETETAAEIDVAEGDKGCVRLVKMCSWIKGGGALGIGYRLFEELAGGSRKRRKNNLFKKLLLEYPGVLVLDEGHTPRNKRTLVWNALSKVSTKRRVILSGTPFQNNFTELYNTLCLVNPEFAQQARQNTKIWSCLQSSVNKNINKDQGIASLRAMIKPFANIYKGGILHTLPGMNESLIILKPTDLQRKLLQKIDTLDNFLDKTYLASVTSVHPSLVIDKPEFSEYCRLLKAVESDPDAGVKTRFLLKLIELAVRQQEKVLVFSQYKKPLFHAKKLLKARFIWSQGREVMHMDGDTSIEQRQCLIDLFNDETSEAKVMLASERACFEGISLVGASRVVLLDVVWNPAVERQAICRAYRLGQRKMVHVYHLMTPEEEKKYARGAMKEKVSRLLFTETAATARTAVRGCEKGTRDDAILAAMLNHESLSSMFERIVHRGDDFFV